MKAIKTIKEMWIPGPLGKLEIRVDETGKVGAFTHRVVIASITNGGEPVYVSPAMMDTEALELWDVMCSLYSAE